DADLVVGASVYFGSSPSGVRLAVPTHEPFEGDPTDGGDVRQLDAPPGLVIRSMDSTRDAIELVNVNNLTVRRLPREGDFLFLEPTENNGAALVAWSIVPNLQFFWLVDAITQGHEIPGRYIGLVAGYAGTQIVALLSLSVLLFQRREVG
ncbi:MAG: hypothetical protein AAFX05_12735, partial [Planctomycetota bacterium]